ncbi:hypothetical protein G4B88_015442 [Cannabis sativa]|uniref:GED domain-containing protein n=1 Tax=Cannabis sativa TaxID=3483 RepID=A0A7J6DNT9_CANSA|nr:hypothetical protein G4B88_015442 [Cannabis sativa]
MGSNKKKQTLISTTNVVVKSDLDGIGSHSPIVSSFNDKIRPVLDAVDKLRNLAVLRLGFSKMFLFFFAASTRTKRKPKNPQSFYPKLCLENSLTQNRTPKNPLTISLAETQQTRKSKVNYYFSNVYLVKAEAFVSFKVSAHKPHLTTDDFPTCESIRLSQSVDKNGERTLAVVTKSDKSPEGLLEKVTSNDVNIGLGFVCVRNRVGQESYEEARFKEAKLFETHSLLSMIDKSIVGIPVLSQKLMQIQATSISRNLPDIVKKINDKLSHNIVEFKSLPRALTSVPEAMSALMKIIGGVKESLRKVLLRGEYFDEFPNDKKMHCKARLVEMVNGFSDELKKCPESDPTRNFLMDEIKHLEEAKEISLPNFLPKNIFLSILKEKDNGISSIPKAFVEKLFGYVEEVVMSVLMSHVRHYYQLQISAKIAGLNLIENMIENSMKWVMEIVEMEKLTDYTCNPEFETEYNKLMAQKDAFMKNLHLYNSMTIERVGSVDLVKPRNSPHLLDQAFDLRMRLVAYWSIVQRRLVDSMALHLQLSVHRLVDEHLERELVSQIMAPNGNLERMLEESPLVASKRAKLEGSIKKLKECKEILAQIMDRTHDQC